MTKTSLMAAATSPARWGVVIVDSFFGQLRPKLRQTVVMQGDLVLHGDQAYEFIGRMHESLLLKDTHMRVWSIPIREAAAVRRESSASLGHKVRRQEV